MGALNKITGQSKQSVLRFLCFIPKAPKIQTLTTDLTDEYGLIGLYPCKSVVSVVKTSTTLF
jgi:hypothetical protein